MSRGNFCFLNEHKNHFSISANLISCSRWKQQHMWCLWAREKRLEYLLTSDSLESWKCKWRILRGWPNVSFLKNYKTLKIVFRQKTDKLSRMMTKSCQNILKRRLMRCLMKSNNPKDLWWILKRIFFFKQISLNLNGPRRQNKFKTIQQFFLRKLFQFLDRFFQFCSLLFCRPLENKFNFIWSDSRGEGGGGKSL